MHKTKKLIFVLGIIILILFSLTGYIRQKYCLPIIMYHSVTPSAAKENRLAITVKTFERQMRFLKEHNYNVVPLETVCSMIKYKKRIPHHTIAITSDDGYKDNYTYAFPVLKKYNLPATIFIIVNEVGRPQNDKLSWDEIKAMQKSGIITIGSHTLGPEPLINIKSEEELKNQIFDSKKILEEKLGRKVNAFSYPEGFFNEKIRQLVIDAGYKVAVATSPGKKFSNTDVFALKRLRISSNADNLLIFWVETSGFYNFIRENRRK